MFPVRSSLDEYAQASPGDVDVKICREADTAPSRSLVALGDRSISRRMARGDDKCSSNKEAARCGEISPQRRPAPTHKPKERPTSKGRVHKGRTRT
jgi:hypothetical protein